MFTLLLNSFLNFEQGLQRVNTGKKEPSQPSLALCCRQKPACCNGTQLLNSSRSNGWSLKRCLTSFANWAWIPQTPAALPSHCLCRHFLVAHRSSWLREPSLNSHFILKKKKLTKYCVGSLRSRCFSQYAPLALSNLVLRPEWDLLA